MKHFGKVFAIATVVIAGLISASNFAVAARTDSKWNERLGSYIETIWPEGRNILINGTNKYLNFGSISGSSGYGIRDNGGSIECKDSGGSWSACQDGNSGGGGGGGIATSSINTEAKLELILTDVTDVFTNNDGALDDDDLSDNDTGDLSEGSNLYWTNARFDARLSATTTLPNLSITESQISDLDHYTNADASAYITSSTTISKLGQTIGASELASADFGSFTCNGTTCTVDNSAISNAMLANSSVSYGGVSVSLGGSDATPAFNLADATGLPISTGVSGLGSNVATWLATPSSANLATAITDETGTGGLVFRSSPAFLSTVTALNLTATGTVNFSSAVLRVPYASAPTVSTNGDIGIDSTANQVKFYSGSASRVLGDGNFYPAFTIYATSTSFSGTTTWPIGPAYVAETWNGIQCFTDVGTINVQTGDGTNWMNRNAASTTVGTTPLSSNNTFTAAEKRYVRLGSPASSPTKVSCTVSKSLTAQ